MSPNSNKESKIAIELKPNPIRGSEEVSITATNIVEQSHEALNNAIDAIHEIADTVMLKMESVPEINRPDEMLVEFGLKLTADARVFVVNAGMEGQFKVALKWIGQDRK